MTKRTYSRLAGTVAAVCALSLAQPPTARAVTDEDFNALKDAVSKMGQKLDDLGKQHEQDQKVHEQDQQQIQQLRQQVGQTGDAATNAIQTAQAAVAQIQPVAAAVQGPSATHNFTMVGDAEIQFGKVDGSHSAFALADFAPIFLFRAGDRVLFEAGFDINLQNGSNGGTPPHDSGSSTSIGLSFAQLDYLINDHMTFVGGDMLLPLGTYSERAAGWLNKIPDDPLARDLLPGSGVGVQLRGAIPLGERGQYLSYSVYGANGPSSTDGSAAAGSLDLGGNVGIKNDGSFGNLHGNPSAGGRVGWFHPFKPGMDLELGISGQSGTWNDTDTQLWSAGVLDGALHITPYFEAKGEYIYTWVDTSDHSTLYPKGWWLQASYKLAGLNLDLPLVNNLELVGRYDNFNDGLGSHADRYTLGYVYYFSNTLLFEGDYEFLNSNNPDLDHNAFIFQVSYGF
jgi:hypothetical protein